MSLQEMLDDQADYIYILKVLALVGVLVFAGGFILMYVVESLVGLAFGILLAIAGSFAVSISMLLLWHSSQSAENGLYRISRHRG